MTNDNRNPAIPLDPKEPRCTPTVPGPGARTCARRLATIPGKYAKVEDYSIRQGNPCNPYCPGYLDVATVTKSAAPAPVAKEYKRGLI